MAARLTHAALPTEKPRSSPRPESVPVRPAPLAPSVSARAPHRARPPTPLAARLRPYAGFVPPRGYHSPCPIRLWWDTADAGARATTRGAAVGRAAPAAGYMLDPASRPIGHRPVAGARRGQVPAGPPGYGEPRWATRCGGRPGHLPVLRTPPAGRPPSE